VGVELVLETGRVELSELAVGGGEAGDVACGLEEGSSCWQFWQRNWGALAAPSFSGPRPVDL